MYKTVVILKDIPNEDECLAVVKELELEGEIVDLTKDFRFQKHINPSVDVLKLLEQSSSVDLVIAFSNNEYLKTLHPWPSPVPLISVDAGSPNIKNFIKEEIFLIQKNTESLFLEEPPLSRQNNVELFGYGLNESGIDLPGTWLTTSIQESPYHAFFDILGKYLQIKSLEPALRGIILTPNSAEVLENKTVQKINNFLARYADAKVFPRFDKSQRTFWRLETELLWQKKQVRLGHDFPSIDDQKNILSNSPGLRAFLIHYDDACNQRLIIDRYYSFLREFVLKIIKPQQSSPKKIFLASANLSGSGRNVSDQEYEQIINFFKDHEYFIVDQAQLSIEEQLGLVMSATHVASMAGSSSFLSLSAPPSTNFIWLNPSQNAYIFPHTYLISKSCNLLYYPYKTAQILEQLEQSDCDKI